MLLVDLTAEGRAPLVLTDSRDYRGAVGLDDARAAAAGDAVPGSTERGPDEMQAVVFTSGTTGAPTGSRSSGHRFEAVLDFTESGGQMTDGTRLSAITAGTFRQVSILSRSVLMSGEAMVTHGVLVHGLEGTSRWQRAVMVWRDSTDWSDLTGLFSLLPPGAVV